MTIYDLVNICSPYAHICTLSHIPYTFAPLHPQLLPRLATKEGEWVVGVYIRFSKKISQCLRVVKECRGLERERSSWHQGAVGREGWAGKSGQWIGECCSRSLRCVFC